MQPQLRERQESRLGGSEISAEDQFLDNLPRIERAAKRVARRAGFSEHEVEDFVSTVKLAFIDNDYARLRRYRGKSTLATYLVVVVNNLFKDLLDRKYGKFRHSKVAERLGPEALALERLLWVERHDVDSAIEILIRNHRVSATREELRKIAAFLPERQQRKVIGEDSLEGRPDSSPSSSPEEGLESLERHRRAEEVRDALERALARLAPQDGLILRMHFRDGCTISVIARSLSLDQRSLYSRRDRCFDTLRSALESEGISWEDVHDLLGWSGAEIRGLLDSGDRSRPRADGKS